MKSDSLPSLLETVTASKETREKLAFWVDKHPDTLEDLLRFVFGRQKSKSVKASWVLDLVAEHNISALYPYLDHFVSGLKGVKEESAIRPLARICEHLVLALDKSPGDLSKRIKKDQLDTLAAVAFEWLIGPHKVAAKVYAMSCLLHIGKHIRWIHPELREILEQNYGRQSAAYQARARMVLKQLDSRGS